jgi:uncharacterized protein YkwD/energy-coupling factor transporter ATP-binding protein EcfA2
MTATAQAIANPFPGLRSFEPEEDFLFFGREERVDELLTKLRRTHFLSVVGSSGSGKSSLVRAGLIPALHGGAMVGSGSNWRVAVFRPGEDPLGRMAQSLSACGLIDNAATDGGGTAMLEATLRRSSLGLLESYRLADLGARDNLLVLVDQFEELFRYRAAGDATYQDDAAAFVKLLIAAAEATDSRVYVALTMRSDFIGNCADYPGLPAAVTRGQYLVPRMTRSEMRDAIIGPIAVAGEEIAPRLVVRLLNEAGEDPEQLPVLQHALMRTWDYWKRDHKSFEPIDIRHYEAIGTMARALSLHADEAYMELDSDRERTIAEKAFKALTEIDEQGRGVRRPTTLKAICAVGNFDEREVRRVLERFREPGRAFLAPPASIALQPSSMIDLGHESIMRVWGRLQTWVTQEQQACRTYARLADSAEFHARGEQSLWRNPELAVGSLWLAINAPNAAWASRYRPGFEQALGFLTESQQAEKKRRLTRWGSIGALVCLALATLAIYALLQKSENAQLKAANQQLNEATNRLQNEVKSLRVRQPRPQVSAPPAPALVVQPVVKLAPPPVKTAPPVIAETPPKANPPAPVVAPPPVDFPTEMLTAHNAARISSGAAPLQWSPALAAKAQKWADTLAATGEAKMEGIPGQNVASLRPVGRGTPTYIVESWAAQGKNYDYEKNTCADGSVKCLPYTQIIWRESKYVGCGTAHDSERDVWVCDYDPPGNRQGARPY